MPPPPPPTASGAVVSQTARGEAVNDSSGTGVESSTCTCPQSIMLFPLLRRFYPPLVFELQVENYVTT